MRRSLWWLLASLYTTQTIALMFFVGAFVAILLEQGGSMEQVSQVYMLGMVWPFKFLWAPLVDRIRFGRLGHYRGWLILMQAGMVLSLLALARFDPAIDFGSIYALCLLIAFLSATQDVAADGLACTLLPADLRAHGNALQIAGGLVGTLLGAGVVLIAYRHVGWAGSMYIMAAATGVSWVQLLFHHEPRQPRAATRAVQVVLRFWTLWRQAGWPAWLAIVLFYTAGSGLAYAVMTPMLVDAGWTLERIGLMLNVLGPLAGTLATFATGWLIVRFGRRRLLVGAAVLQLLGIGAVALPLWAAPQDSALSFAVIVYFLCYNPAAVVLATLMMDRVSAQTPATDYTLQFSLNQFVAFGAISAGAALAAQLGYGGVLALAGAAGLAAVALALVYRVPAATAAPAPAPTLEAQP